MDCEPSRLRGVQQSWSGPRSMSSTAPGLPRFRAAQQATATIPTLGVSDDMVGEGLVPSLAHPGRNSTGVSIFATELDGKRQEFLIELIPGVRYIAAFADSRTAVPKKLEALQDAARTRGVELLINTVGTPEEIAPALDASEGLGRRRVKLAGLASPQHNCRIIFECTAALGLPVVYQWPEAVQEGRPHRVRPEHCPDLSSAGVSTARRAVAWDRAHRYPGRAADEFRAGRQPADRESVRPESPGIVPGAG